MEAQASLDSGNVEAHTPQWKYQPDSMESAYFSAHVKVFHKILRHFIVQSSSRIQHSARPKNEEQSVALVVNGDLGDKSMTEEQTGNDQGKAVLTLFGNAQGQHKQLFSSFQKPLPHQFWAAHQTSNRLPTLATNALIPVRESGLPGNQLVSTRLVSVGSEGALPGFKQRLKFRDLFQPSSSVPALIPPKSLSSTNARSSSITWTNDASSKEIVRKNDYTTEKLSTGHWLGYDGVSSEQESASPEAKRRRRDRALSSGEASMEPSEHTKAALAQAKEDALFRKVYSSFAPSIDNSSALIPEETKNVVWWRKVGEPWYSQILAIDPELEKTDIGLGGGGDDMPNDDDDDDFTELIENWVSPNLDAFKDLNVSDQETQTSQHLLEKISELLESLQSHQRLRNSQLGPGVRPTAVPTSAAKDLPAPQPSDTERAVYDDLRERLTELVSRLAPYQLAKVDGQRLSSLILSRDVILESKNYQGTMDDDHATRLSAIAAADTASSSARNAPAPRPGTFSHNRNPSGQGTSNTSLNTSRSGQISKPSLNHWQTPAHSYSSGVQRSSYNPPSTYGRTPLNQYLNGRPIAANQPNGVSMSYSQNSNSPLYQQRAPNTPTTYGGYSQAPGGARNTQSLHGQTGYPSLVSRPPSNTYLTPTTSGNAPQAPISGNRITARQSISGASPSPLPQGSPYAPPQASAVPRAPSNHSRPETPSTPTAAQAPAQQLPQQSPTLGPAQSLQPAVT